MRDYGTTNAAPYSVAPTVGLTGDTYWNAVEKALYVSDGTVWVKAGPGAGGPPSGTAGGDLSGSYPNPTVVQASGNFQAGSTTAKMRMFTGNQAFLDNNNLMGTQDDAAKPSWGTQLDLDLDRFTVNRRAPGGGLVGTPLLTLDAAGSLTIPTYLNIGPAMALNSETTANITNGYRAQWRNDSVGKVIDLSANETFVAGYDNAFPTVFMRLAYANTTNPSIQFYRRPVGGGSGIIMALMDTNGINGAYIGPVNTLNGDRLIAESVAQAKLAGRASVFHTASVAVPNMSYNTASTWQTICTTASLQCPNNNPVMICCNIASWHISSGTGANSSYWRLLRDGVTGVGGQHLFTMTGVAGLNQIPLPTTFTFIDWSPGAGNHTYNIQWYLTTGTLSTAAAGSAGLVQAISFT